MWPLVGNSEPFIEGGDSDYQLEVVREVCCASYGWGV
jgi:hypothetical protein